MLRYQFTKNIKSILTSLNFNSHANFEEHQEDQWVNYWSADI